MDFISHKQDILGRPGRKVYDMRPRPRAGRGGASFPWEKCSFGYKINPDGDNAAAVKIFNGMLIADSTARMPVEVSHDAFVISGTQTVYVQADVRNVANTAELTLTRSSSLYYRYYRLFEFTEENGAINDTLTKIYRPFDIESGFDDTVIPEGSADTPHQVWNPATETWEAGVIVPNGSADSPHLIWDTVKGAWRADKLLEMPDGGDTWALAVWDPSELKWSLLVTLATDEYKVIRVFSTGQPEVDWVRWA